MEPTQQDPQVMHDFNEKKSSSSSFLSIGSVLLFLGVIIVGVGGGYLLSMHTKSATVQMSGSSGTTAVTKGTLYGSTDTTTFKDTAEGVLQKGGIKGEGQFHLVRPGGDSQNVYLTSTVLDLSQFVGMKIKVWGATQTAQYAGWLMEAGRVQVE